MPTVEPSGLKNQLESLIPGDILQTQGNAARHRIRSNQIQIGKVSNQLQYGSYFNALEIQRNPVTDVVEFVQPFALFFFAQRRDRENVFVAGLIGEIVVKTFSSELQTRPALGCADVDALYRRGKVGHIETANQRLIDVGIQKLQRNVATLTENRGVHRRICHVEYQQTLAVG